MKKMPTVYVRDETDRKHVTDEVNPGCEWVLAGEGLPTRKYDGTCVMLDQDGIWWARREVKPGKAEPENFLKVNYDHVTGKSMGWEPIDQSSWAKFWSEAIGWQEEWEPGTYELIGPKINGNPEQAEKHRLVKHSDAEFVVDESIYDSIKEMVRAVTAEGWEGVVWHHRDGRMAKLKGRDLR